MARKVIEELVDDIDGQEASETVKFSYRGTDYEVDLSEKNMAKMDKALARYVGVARKVKTTRPVRTLTRANAVGPDPRDIREWAKSEGIEVSARGRVPADVTRQYEAAQR
jgi:hypothetical protein